MTKPAAPETLAKGGRKLWSTVVDKYDLRVDELRTLEDACHEVDLIDLMVAGMKGKPLVVDGSKGSPVVNPLLPELRQHRNILKSLMQSLKLPEDGDTEREAGDRSTKARAAANARWSRRGA